MPAIPVRSPSPLAIENKLDLTRSLRPLLRRKNSTTRRVLHESETVRQIADTGIWQVVLRPALDRWMDVDLIIEMTSNMRYWQWLADELESLLRSIGAFRHLRRWLLHLETSDGQPALTPYSLSGLKKTIYRRPAEITSYAGGKLAIWISDCTAPVWHDGRVLPLLDLWSRKNLLTLLPVLPYRLWHRTGLRNAFETRLRNQAPIRRNTDLDTEAPLLWPFSPEHKTIGIPVLDLEVQSLNAWAELVTSVHTEWIPGLVFPPANQEVLCALQNIARENLNEAIDDAGALVERFYAASSETAWKLAIYLSIATPLNIHVMRLIQQSMLPESGYDHLIEVLLGGILTKVPSKQQEAQMSLDLFEFIPGVRERLNNYLPRDQALRVLTATSEFISRHSDSPIDFPALLANPDLVSDLRLDPTSQEFARVSSQMLKRYGGDFAVLGDQLEKVASLGSGQTDDTYGSNGIPLAEPKIDLSVDLITGGFMIGSISGDHVMGSKISAEPNSTTALRQAYLNIIVEKASYLSLAGIDPKAASQAESRLSLGAVYTALLTHSLETENRIGDPVDRFLPQGLIQRPKGQISALEQLDRHPRLVLLGDPGSGKSTFVNFVALCLAGEALGLKDANLKLLTAPLPAEKEDRQREKSKPQPWSHGKLLPLRIVLHDFAARGLPPVGEKASAKHLWDFIATGLDAATLGEFCDPLQQELLEQGGLLLLDGLDEIPEAHQRRVQIKHCVEDFSKTYPKCRILVTSRTYAYQNQDWRLDGYAQATLAPFSLGQVRQFVDHWYAHMAVVRRMNEKDAQGKAELLKRAISGSDRLSGLAERPLLLTLMASLHAWRGGSLPEKREELYADAVDLLLDWWERQRVIRDAEGQYLLVQPSLLEFLKVDRQNMRDLLNELAFKAHESQPDLQGTADIAEGDLLSGLMRIRENQNVNPRELVEYLSSRAGLLLPRGVGVYTFPHRAFQEYLTACYLTDHDYPELVAELACNDLNRWREVALLVGAKANRAAASLMWSLVDALRLQKFNNTKRAIEAPQNIWPGALLAGQIIAENINSIMVTPYTQEKLEQAKKQLVEVITQSNLSAAERAAAGDALAALGDPRFDPEFLYLLKEPLLGFVHIPAGPFLMGSDKKSDPDSYDSEQPQHEVTLSDYYLARYPVTQAQFYEFVHGGGYADPRYWAEATAADVWKDGAIKDIYFKPRQGPYDYGEPFSLPNHPVTGITWWEALAYCRWLEESLKAVSAQRSGEISVSPQESAFWRGLAEEKLVLSLPSEAEWEKAARGVDGRIYPWGEAFDADKANTSETGLGTTNAVGCFPGGASPYGLLEMSGNVWEWTRNLAKEYPYIPDDGRENLLTESEERRVLRGGSFNSNQMDSRCAKRIQDYVTYEGKYRFGGFRVAVIPNTTLNSKTILEPAQFEAKTRSSTMDPATISKIATVALSVLVQIFAKDIMGEQTSVVVNELWNNLKAKFAEQQADKDALTDLLKNPEDPDYQAAFRIQLEKAMEEDPAFAESFKRLVEEASAQIATQTRDSDAMIDKGRIDERIRQGEDQTTEFKATLRIDPRTGEVQENVSFAIARTLSAFMNSDGGVLIIGVSESKGVVGLLQDINSLENKGHEGFRLEVYKIIERYLDLADGQYIRNISFGPYQGEDICWIEVEASDKPVFCRRNNRRGYYKRIDTSEKLLDTKEAMEDISNRFGKNESSWSQ